MSLEETLSMLSEFKAIYATWTGILILEMAMLTGTTGSVRMRTQVFHSDEDRKRYANNPKVILHPHGGGHPDVDRIRSAHFKDLNIILLFLIITPIWFTTLPSHSTVKINMSVFSISKILETIVYMNFIKAPGLSKVLLNLCYGTVGYMAIVCIWYYL